MEAVLPVYEDSIGAAFYNGCIVAAIEAIRDALPSGKSLTVLELGAGTGGGGPRDAREKIGRR